MNETTKCSNTQTAKIVLSGLHFCVKLVGLRKHFAHNRDSSAERLVLLINLSPFWTLRHELQRGKESTGAERRPACFMFGKEKEAVVAFCHFIGMMPN